MRKPRPSSKGKLRLSNLPSDIILNIIRLEMNSIDDVRLISPRWNTLAETHLNSRHNLPPIKTFTYERSSSDGHAPLVMLSAILPINYTRYFGVHKWLCIPSKVDNIGEVKMHLRLYEHGDFSKIRRIFLRIFKRCSKIETLNIWMNELDNYLIGVNFIVQAIGSLPINAIAFTKLYNFSAHNGPAIHTLAQIPSVRSMVLKDKIRRKISDPRPHLLSAVPVMRDGGFKIVFTQSPAPESEWGLYNFYNDFELVRKELAKIQIDARLGELGNTMIIVLSRRAQT